jgi:hypothetical protein
MPGTAEMPLPGRVLEGLHRGARPVGDWELAKPRSHSRLNSSMFARAELRRWRGRALLDSALVSTEEPLWRLARRSLRRAIL